ncbi:hypothetical protein FN846DRAFT_39961 [Sphaerosporella brunnea]|uniref:Uncharacterized protein n=1 Tax=Sphaerosporella brunnea TaxID=1250544 RepID=A0A5J5FAN6_9PEZI|nr:hypothetical protein FN846DRAFT_39961 [Sphaerosporella brunnea]
MARTTAISIPTDSSNAAESSPPSSPASSVSSTEGEQKRFDPWLYHRRRPSLLSTSFCRAEHTTFDLGIRDGSPRVITYVKTSQGFDWNQDIFLPSSSDITIHNGINTPEQVVDIVLTEEDRFLPS